MAPNSVLEFDWDLLLRLYFNLKSPVSTMLLWAEKKKNK